jgi:hypothetical protein
LLPEEISQGGAIIYPMLAPALGQRHCHYFHVENSLISTTFGVDPLAYQDIVE